jgi:hypothetical protein
MPPEPRGVTTKLNHFYCANCTKGFGTRLTCAMYGYHYFLRAYYSHVLNDTNVERFPISPLYSPPR